MKALKKFKKSVMFIMVAVLVLSTCSAFASSDYYRRNGIKRTYTGRKYQVIYNGKKLSTASRYGLMINDNVMVPYKALLVKKGPKLKSSYNVITKTITFKYKKNTAKFVVNKKVVYVNGVKEKINTEPLKANMAGSNLIVVPAKAVCAALGLIYEYDRNTKSISITPPAPVSYSSVADSDLQASDFNGMTTSQFIEKVGPIAQQDYQKTGVLASVTMAQAINESGWGKSSLAQKSNNMFGMKISLSGNTWGGSVWDGLNYVAVTTREEYGGKKVSIVAKFRKYNSVAASIADHSAYLVNAKNGSSNRYAGLTATKSYTKQLQILQKGGYCTWSGYVSELTATIKKYDLTRFDK